MKKLLAGLFGRGEPKTAVTSHPNAEEPLVIFPIPSLVSVLLAQEIAKGAPLTEAEVNDARDQAECVAVPVSVVPSIVEGRGYDDINPERAWEEWQAIRDTLPHT